MHTESPFTPRTVALLLALPVVLVVAFGALQGLGVPLGDDWELYEQFDLLHLDGALLAMSDEPHGFRFRPLAYGHVWFERHALGLDFVGNRFVGLVYLGLGAGALGMLLTLLGARLRNAVLGSLVFAFFPSLAEVHGWSAARVDQMATCFGLFALVAALRDRVVLAVALFLAAFLCKESAYALLIAPGLLVWSCGVPQRQLVRAACTAPAAFGAYLAIKVGAIGSVVGSWWFVSVPWADRVAGYASYALPLGLWPVSTSADGSAGVALGAGFAALFVIAMGSAWRGARETRRRSVVLLVCSLACLTIVAGVPARDDLAQARLWYLPAGFLVAAVALTARTTWLVGLLACAAPLLHLNLAPYREADARMRRFLGDMEVHVREHQRAVRVRGLPEYHGPVPLFALMPVPYMLRFGGEVGDHPLVSVDVGDRALEDVRAMDDPWRELMRTRGRPVLDLGWDDAEGRVTPH